MIVRVSYKKGGNVQVFAKAKNNIPCARLTEDEK